MKAKKQETFDDYVNARIDAAFEDYEVNDELSFLIHFAADMMASGRIIKAKIAIDRAYRLLPKTKKADKELYQFISEIVSDESVY